MEITRDQELALMGFRVLADGHNAHLEDITRAVRAIVGEEDKDWGHSSDFVYAHVDVSELLRKLEVTVAPPMATLEEENT